MPLIDYSFFNTEINIPNLNRPGVLEPLNNMIKKWEPKVLTGLLGYKLYKAFTDGILVDPIDQRWVDLKDGKEYTTSSGVFKKWIGLVIVDGTEKLALSANYVYYKFLRYQAEQNSGVGAVATKTENSQRVSPARLQAKAWNEMVEWGCQLRQFIEDNISVYPEYSQDYGKDCEFHYPINHLIQ